MEAMFSPQDKGNVYVRRALQYIAAHFAAPLTLEAVAREISVSPNYLSMLFHKTVGLTFRERLCRVRVEESKRLLLNSKYSLKEIAVAVGFTDQSYFTKVFKHLTGLSPGKFRG